MAVLLRLGEQLDNLWYEPLLCTEVCETKDAIEVHESVVLDRGLRCVATGRRMLLVEAFELSDT